MANIVLRDVFMMLQAYGVLFGLQLIGFALIWKFLGKYLIDGGWVLGRLAGSLALTLLIWWTGYAGIPINNNLGLGFAIVLILIAGWRGIKKDKKELRKLFKSAGELIVVEEILFLAGFVTLAIVRAYQPDINGLEKFMDFGFIKSYLSHADLPGKDMWWATSTINYYTFGHFWAAIMIRLMGVPAEVGYNLMLAVILGLGLSISFGVVIGLMKKGKVRHMCLGGVAGALIVNLGGNSHAMWYFLKNKFNFARYWYPDATRFIPQPTANTIHEFPAYSYVVSDLHAHVLGLPHEFGGR